MRNLSPAIVAALTLLVGGAPVEPASAGAYYVAGQAHPRFHLDIAINGKAVKSVQPRSGKPKLFLTQLDEGTVASGENTLTVNYRVLSESEAGDAPTPSFRVKVTYQDNPQDKDTAVELINLRGPGKPFETSVGMSLSQTFNVP